MNSLDEQEHLLEGFNTPGYIIDQFQAVDNKKLFMRAIMLSETFWVELSNRLIKEKGQEGKEILYTIGKQFGYRLATFNRFPRGNVSKATIRPLWDFFINSTIFTKATTFNADPQTKVMEIEVENLVVTKKSGPWYTPIGAGGGLWCYMFDDYSLECSAKRTKDGTDLIMWAPTKALLEKGYEVIRSDKMPQKISIDEYMMHNRAVTTGSKHTFGKLLQESIVSYKNNILYVYGAERIFPLELSILASLEQFVDEKTLFKASYKPFYEMGLLSKSPSVHHSNITEMLTGFGFGVAEVTSDKTMTFTFNGYPWFPQEYDSKSFGYIKGAIIGFFDGSTGKKHKIDSVASTIQKDALKVDINISKD